MKHAEKNRDPRKGERRAPADLRCAMAKVCAVLDRTGERTMADYARDIVERVSRKADEMNAKIDAAAARNAARRE
jgi:hypothetical protein